jgi:hypothetical protein
MPVRFAVLALMLAVMFGQTWGQTRGRRSGPKANPEAPGAGMPTPTMEGTLKMMTNKEITLQLQSEQMVIVRRDRKTKFLENGKEVKPSDIAVGTPLAIDVKEDLDLKPLAVRVIVNPPPPKPEQK